MVCWVSLCPFKRSFFQVNVGYLVLLTLSLLRMMEVVMTKLQSNRYHQQTNTQLFTG